MTGLEIIALISALSKLLPGLAGVLETLQNGEEPSADQVALVDKARKVAKTLFDASVDDALNDPDHE